MTGTERRTFHKNHGVEAGYDVLMKEGGLVPGSGPFTSSHCPQCGLALELRIFSGAELEVCCSCTSALLKQSDLARVLDSVTARAVGNVDPDAELIALPHRTNIAACPRCHGLMEKADYCAAKLVFFDRCNSCELLWVARDQLEAMALIWARMEGRRARTKAKLADDLALMDALFYSHSNL